MAHGYNGLPSYYTTSTDPMTPNVGFSLQGLDPVEASNWVLADTAIGGGGGSSVKINGVTVTNPNFNNTTPAAPTTNTNVTWQVDGSGMVSAYLQLAITKASVSSNWLRSYDSSTGLFTSSQPAASDLSNGTTGTGAVVLASAIASFGSGTVTSVAMTGDGVIFNSTVAGSPIIVTGTLIPALLTQAANTFLSGPISGGSLSPTFRVLDNADIPTTLSSLVEIDVDTIKLDHTNKDIILTRVSSGVMGFAGSETLTGSIRTVQLSTPAAPTVTPTNGSSATWTYKIYATDALGSTLSSALGSTTTGAATLDSTHFNTITWSSVTGAASYKVFRQNVATSPTTTGVIATVSATATLSVVDNGLAGDGTATPPFNTTGQVLVGAPTVQNPSIGYFVGPGYLSPFALATTATKITDAAQDVYAYQFVLPFSILVGQVTIQVSGLGGAGSTITVGLYQINSDGTTTKVIDSGTFNGNSAGNQTKAITPVLVQPGVYWFAQSASTATTLTAFTITLNGTSINLINGQTGAKVGKAANQATSGVLPPALGAITKDATVNPVFAQFTP